MYMESTEDGTHVTLIPKGVYQFLMYMESIKDTTQVILILTGVNHV